MPFKSEKQRRWMRANNPEMAKKWEKEEKMKKETMVRELIKKLVGEVMSENTINERLVHLIKFSIPNNQTRKADTILLKMKSKWKEGRDYDWGKSKRPGHMMLRVDKKIADDVLGWLIQKNVKKIHTESFAGSFSGDTQKEFDKQRREQSEVLGYKLMGVDDVRSEIGDATVHEEAGSEWKDTSKKQYSEAKKRDYKAEYKKYGSSKKAKKYRAELNKYNRQKGTYGNGDKKDASHKGGKIVGFEKESVNRGRAEKSRLKKEGKLSEGYFRVSSRTEVQWQGNDIIILANKAKVRLSKKELVSMLKGLKRNRVIESAGNLYFEAKKETIFDVAARVLKNKSMENYKAKRGKVKLDMQTANLLTKVWKKTNSKMRKYLSDLGYKDPAQLVQTLWAVVK